jgi:hypothetical protein
MVAHILGNYRSLEIDFKFRRECILKVCDKIRDEYYEHQIEAVTARVMLLHTQRASLKDMTELFTPASRRVINQRIRNYLRLAPEKYQEKLFVTPELREILARQIIAACPTLSEEELRRFFELPKNFNVIPARARLPLADRQALYHQPISQPFIPGSLSLLQAQPTIASRVFNAWFEVQPLIVKENYLALAEARKFKKSECARALEQIPEARREQIVQQKWQAIMQSDLSYAALMQILHTP